MVPWLPESPRWLLLVNREEKAWEIVRDLHASPHDVEHEYAAAEFSQMKAQFEIDRSLSSSWITIARRPSYRKRALIAFALPVILYSTGNLVITSESQSPLECADVLISIRHSVRGVNLRPNRLRCRPVNSVTCRHLSCCHSW